MYSFVLLAALGAVCMSPSVTRGNLLGGFLEAASIRKGEAHSVLRETWLLLWGARACLISRAAPFTEQVQLGSCWRLSNRKLRNKVTQATTYVTADGEACPRSLILLLSCFLCRSLHLGKHTCNTQMSTMYKHVHRCIGSHMCVFLPAFINTYTH